MAGSERRLEAPAWDGPTFGEWGVIAASADGRHVMCHVCGEWYVSVASHSNGAHGINADTYRQAFGLAQATPLVAPALSRRFRIVSSARLLLYKPIQAANRTELSAEELHDRHVVGRQQWRVQHVVDGSYEAWYRLWTGRWEAAYQRLLAYIEAYGHALVPVRYRTPDGYHLGAWVVTQRERRRDGDLDPDKSRRLEGLSGWAWDGQQARSNRKWYAGYAALTRYQQREGDASPPQRHVEDGYPLGGWVKTQRTLHRNGQLPDPRRAALEDLPGWVWNANDSAWNHGYQHLQRYAAITGDTRVPLGHRTPDGYRLGQWTGWQRALGRDSRLAPERRERLEALPGWRWRLR